MRGDTRRRITWLAPIGSRIDDRYSHPSFTQISHPGVVFATKTGQKAYARFAVRVTQ